MLFVLTFYSSNNPKTKYISLNFKKKKSALNINNNKNH